MQLRYSEAEGPASVYYYALGAGPISGIEWQVPEGSTASEQAVLAATQIAADAARLGLSVQVGAPEDYPPTPPEPDPDEVLQMYLRRAEQAPRLLAHWSAYNHRKSESGEWPPEDFGTFQASITSVVTALVSTGWGKAVEEIAGFDHPLATPQAKRDYFAIMAQFEPELAFPEILDEEEE